jgi:adenosine deaminase
MITTALLRDLPKTDLHVHLDGSLRERSVIEMARERGVRLPADSIEGLNALVFKPAYASLEEYLTGFAYTCAVLQDAEALERAAWELAWDNIDEGVRYIEVRFAPQLHMHRGFDFDAVLGAVNRGLRRAQDEHGRSEAVLLRGEPPFRFGIVVCAMRYFNEHFSQWYGQLLALFPRAPEGVVFPMASEELARAAVRARDELGIPIVGFDLAGREDGYPAHHHAAAFAYAHRNFLKKTVHAGEAYGPESMFDAITALYADRIGHGYHLFSPELCGPGVGDPAAYTRRLAQYIADRRVTLEVCITSNLQTNPSIGTVENHVFGRFLSERLSATLCTDNRLVSHTSVTREVELAVHAFGMDLRQLRHTIIYGFKRSFFPGDYTEKRTYVRQIIDYYDAVVERHAAASAR